MFSLNMHDILMWIAIASLVVLVSTTGMYINRFFIHRAHRRALAELHRRASESERTNRAVPPSAESLKVRT